METPSRREDDGRTETAGPASRGGEPSQSFALGAVIAGRYRIEAFLAEGGMGQVYRAHDLDLDVPLALKTIHPGIASSADSLRRFKQEVLLARSVTHRNVCRIFDLQRDAATGVAFLTMEFLAGETLSSRIQRRGPLAAEVALPLIRQMADALDAAHRAGIVHRDFKSSNVMVVETGEEGRAVITDFGLAVTLGSPAAEGLRGDVAAGALVGTPAYMSPEQVRGEAVGPAADLYALGVVLFEMCTGELPFHGATGWDTARAHLTTAPPSPRTLATIDEAWEGAILRLLAKSPSERFATAYDAVRVLEGHVVDRAAAHHSLPAENDAFVGRTTELAAIAAQLDPANPHATRLLTVQGPGGAGKTRLAQRYGWDHLADWPGGVWFCDMSEARGVDAMATAVAASLGVPLRGDDPIVQLGHAIASRGRCLLVLDNFEQLVEHAEATLGRWLDRAPEASFLVTSQERLQLPGGRSFALEPLDPATQGVELFEVRAQAHRPGFVVDAANRPQVEAIARSLDGLPLAIELAASRLRMLSLEQLGARLRDRFKILAAGTGGRHATLRATLDWSWDLLAPWEQSAMMQVSVFEGGFTLEAAEAVVELSGFEETWLTLDVIQSLVDKSWLRARVVRGAPRFEMYTSVQEYASAKLRAWESGATSGSSADRASTSAVEAKHGAFYACMGTEAAIDSLDRHGGLERRSALQWELDNLVAACRRAIHRGDEATAVATYAASHKVFALTGPSAASIQLGREVLEKLAGPGERGRALATLAEAERLAGKMEEAREHYEAALSIHHEAGDRRSEGHVLGNLGIVRMEQGQLEKARAYYEAALVIQREMGNRSAEGIVLGNMGTSCHGLGLMEEARVRYEAALAIHREVGNRRFEGVILGNLAGLDLNTGRMEEAFAHYSAALAIHREAGDRRSEGIVLGNLGILHLEQGRMEEARSHYEAALAIHREVGNRRFEGVEVTNLGNLHQAAGRWEAARGLYEAALHINRAVGDRRLEGALLGNLGDVHRAQGRTEQARAHYDAALVIHREVGNRSFEAIVLASLGDLYCAQGRTEDARGCLGASIVLLRELGDQVELGKTLCSLGELRLRDDVAAARDLLAEAKSIAKDLAVEPESELARKIAGLREALGERQA
jgi:predicted ATPase/Tfp pilus assembly protein PilF